MINEAGIIQIAYSQTLLDKSVAQWEGIKVPKKAIDLILQRWIKLTDCYEYIINLLDPRGIFY